MVDTPLDQLLEIGYADLHKNQAEFNALAKEVDPDKTPQQVLAELGDDHPAPDQLLAELPRHVQRPDRVHSARSTSSPSPPMSGRLSKRRRHSCVPRPWRPWTRRARSRPTPPGLLQRHAAGEGLDAPSTSPTTCMRSIVGTIVSTSVHEAYPGPLRSVPHGFLQAPSKVRKLLGANTKSKAGRTTASR